MQGFRLCSDFCQFYAERRTSKKCRDSPVFCKEILLLSLLGFCGSLGHDSCEFYAERKNSKTCRVSPRKLPGNSPIFIAWILRQSGPRFLQILRRTPDFQKNAGIPPVFCKEILLLSLLGFCGSLGHDSCQFYAARKHSKKCRVPPSKLPGNSPIFIAWILRQSRPRCL